MEVNTTFQNAVTALFIALWRYYIFYKWKIYGISPFSLLHYLLWCSLISDVCYYNGNYFRVPHTAHIRQCINLIPVICVLTVHQWAVLSSLSLSLGLSIPWDLFLEIRQVYNLRVASKCLSEKQSYTSLFKSKARNNWAYSERQVKNPNRPKLGLLQQTRITHCEGKGKVKEGNQKCCSSEHINNKKVKKPYCWYGEHISGMGRRSDQPQHSKGKA